MYQRGEILRLHSYVLCSLVSVNRRYIRFLSRGRNMPKIEVIRKGVTPAVRPVPTDTTLAVLPVTLDRLDREVESEDEEATRIDSVEDAFNKFKPTIHFETYASASEARFVADLEF